MKKVGVRCERRDRFVKIVKSKKIAIEKKKNIKDIHALFCKISIV